MGCCLSNNNNGNKISQVQNRNVPSASVEQIINASKSICNIHIEGIIDNGTGFFLEINPRFKCFLTNYHIISDEVINRNSIVEIKNNSGKKLEIKLNKNERYIKTFKKYDITVVEIKNSDGINKYFSFLQYDLSYKNNYQTYYDQAIFIVHFPDNEAKQASGRVENINNDYDFTHNVDTTEGSSGSPIFLISNSKVIGIHKEGSYEEEKNYGTFIGIIIEEINKDLIKIIPKKKDDKPYVEIGQHDNYIIAEFLIDRRNIMKDVLIINSYERTKGNVNNNYYEEKLKNEKEIKECEIIINGEKINFSYTYNFKKEGKYKIIYSFKNLINTNHMFLDCSSLINIDLSRLNTSYISNMSYMFADCSILANINLSNINTQKNINMEGIFHGCSSLVYLDLSSFDTQNVINMSYAFANCSSLKNLDLSNFNTQNVIDMSYMFGGCSSLGDIYLTNFNTQKVNDMSSMFADCSSLQNLDLSSFDTRNVTNMSEMFIGCESLTYLNLSNFTTPNIINIGGIFTCCNSLKKENVKTKDKKILEEFDLWIKMDQVGSEFFKELFNK
jgi:surface protein